MSQRRTEGNGNKESNKELEIRKKTRDHKKSPTHSTQNCIKITIHYKNNSLREKR